MAQFRLVKVANPQDISTLLCNGISGRERQRLDFFMLSVCCRSCSLRIRGHVVMHREISIIMVRVKHKVYPLFIHIAT